LILEKLENQFDRLCDELILVLANEVIDVEGATEMLSALAPNASKESIRSCLNGVANAQDKKKHNVFTSLNKKKADIETKVKGNVYDKELSKMKTKDFKKEYNKIVESSKKYYDYISKLKNPEAK